MSTRRWRTRVRQRGVLSPVWLSLSLTRPETRRKTVHDHPAKCYRPTPDGCRARDWDTRTGTIELAIPKLRAGSYFPDWLLERRKRAEKAMISVVAISYLLGVLTRWMEELLEQLGITRLSKSQVVGDGQGARRRPVEQFRTRPLDAGPYTFVAADALTMKVREGRPGGGPTTCWSPPASTPTDTARSSAWRSPPPSPRPAGSNCSAASRRHQLPRQAGVDPNPATLLAEPWQRPGRRQFKDESIGTVDWAVDRRTFGPWVKR